MLTFDVQVNGTDELPCSGRVSVQLEGKFIFDIVNRGNGVYTVSLTVPNGQKQRLQITVKVNNVEITCSPFILNVVDDADKAAIPPLSTPPNAAGRLSAAIAAAA